jgi:hypothetical protein
MYPLWSNCAENAPIRPTAASLIDSIELATCLPSQVEKQDPSTQMRFEYAFQRVAIEMLQLPTGHSQPVPESLHNLMLRRGGRKEDETPENGDTVCFGLGAPFVGLGPAFQGQWPQMVAPHKEKSPPEQRAPREACSPRLETQNPE